MSKIIKSYKAFDKDFKCRDFQYEVGKEYEMSDIQICDHGFHACENPLDTWNFYDLTTSRFAEVEQSGEIQREDDATKVCSSKIKIKAELSLAGIIIAGIEWIQDKTKIGSSGYYAKIGSSGDSAKIGSSGGSAQIGSSGDYAQIGSSGNSARIGSSGDSAQIGSSGDYARIGSSGYDARIGSSGGSAQIGSSGDYARINSTGEDSVIVCAGLGSAVKAKVGSWITLAEWKYDDEKVRRVPTCVKTFYVDGEQVKGDTWYTLKNGELKEIHP